MSESEAETQALRPRRRRVLLWCGCGLGAVIALPVLIAAALVWMAYDHMVRLPDMVQTRIEARLDQAMAANDIHIADMGIALRDGGVTPQIVLSGVEMYDADGLRAAFPEVSVHMNGRALMRGEMRPYRVALTGAGLTIRRDAQGQFDLALTDAAEGPSQDLQETLGRIDSMFAQPIFAHLEEISGTGLEVVFDDQLAGQQMRAHNATMRLERKAAALTLVVGGEVEGTRDASFSLAVTRNPDLARTDMRMQFQNFAARDVAAGAPALAWIDLLRAPISGAVTSRLADDGTLGDLSGALDIGQGEIRLGEGVAPLPFTALGAYFDYDAASARLTFSELSVASPALRFVATGHADVMPDGLTYLGQFQFGQITANPEGIFEAAVEIEGAAVDLRLTLAPEVRVEIGQAVLFDGDLRLNASGSFVAAADGLRSRIDASIPEVEADQVLPFWPTQAIPNTRGWLERNLLAGTLSDVRFALRQDPGHVPAHALRMDFSDTTLRALRDMPPIEHGRGYLTLTGPRFALALNEGEVPSPDGGRVTLAGSTMVIEDLRPRGPETRFDLRVGGAVPDVLSLLTLPPVNLMADSDRDPRGLANGDARLRTTLALPLLRQVPYEAIDFDVTGVIDNLRSDTLVPGRMLTARALDVSVAPQSLLISGRVALDGVTGTGQWRRAIGPGAGPESLLEGSAPLSAETLAAFGVDLPRGMVAGQAAADFTLPLGGEGPLALTLRSDLTGLALALDPLGWRKDRATEAEMTATVALGPNPSLPDLRLSAPGLDLDGAVTLREGGGFDRLTATRLRVADWLDVTGALIGRGAGRAPEIEVSGGSVDLRRAPGTGGGGQGGSTGPLNLRLDRVQVSNGIALTELRAELTTPGGLSGQFRGNVNGNAPVAGTLVTTENGAAVRLRAEDGGAVLRAAGLYENAYGGAMDLIMQPTGSPGTYDGRVTLDGPRLRNAPAMAELLNLISVVGLLEQLGGEGINLGDVEARFRLSPRAVVIDQGSAVGPSLGVSMDGVYDIANRRFDLQGVVSPLYIVNGLVGALFAPRREGLFGFSYRLTGTPENTNVAVNPLSILTPGIFREIFRRPPPELSQ